MRMAGRREEKKMSCGVMAVKEELTFGAMGESVVVIGGRGL